MAISDISVPHNEGPKASGTQPWSSVEQYVVFSIDGESDWQRRLTFEQFLADRSIGFKQVIGSYKGVQEHAWIINARDWAEIREWQPFEFQESILHLGPWHQGSLTQAAGREATLAFADQGQSDIRLGTFQQVSKALALSLDAWTLDGGEYYACL